MVVFAVFGAAALLKVASGVMAPKTFLASSCYAKLTSLHTRFTDLDIDLLLLPPAYCILNFTLTKKPQNPKNKSKNRENSLTQIERGGSGFYCCIQDNE